MKKILIVDDEKPISDIIKFNLAKEGYDTITAFDGREALSKYEEENPDLIILDLMLPELDGLEVAKEVRKNSHVPIIMLSAKDSEFDKVIGLEIGADDYVTKPFSNRELLARVKRIFAVLKILNPQWLRKMLQVYLKLLLGTCKSYQMLLLLKNVEQR